MSKYELSLSRDYVPDWGVVDAVRELFQNALDQQTTIEGNEMFFDYDESCGTLKIGNKHSVLNPATLLLGSSSKRNDDDTIGQFGEGYKIATLVLTRMGKRVIFYNYGRREVWRPRFVKSRRYGADILTFFTDKKYVWNKVPDNNLTITVENVTPEEYAEILESNLHLNPPEEVLKTEFGRVLLDKNQVGRVYVNGLFICTYASYHCGYDFNPKEIELDRDRKLVSDFNLQWLASKMWSVCNSKELIEKAAYLASIDAADVKFIGSVSGYSSENVIGKVADTAYSRFLREHGTNAVPIFQTDDMATLSSNYKPIIVTESYYSLLKRSSSYVPPMIVKAPSLKECVQFWLEQWQDELPEDAQKELEDILEASTNG